MAEDTFREVIKEAILRAGGLRSLSRVLVDAGVRVSATQLANLRDGLSPYDLRVTKAMEAVYPDLAERLYRVLGMRPVGDANPELASSLEKTDVTGALPIPPGARQIGSGDPLRLGPAPSAQDSADIGDVGYDTYSLDGDAKASGADYIVRVKGHCLEPFIRDGDMVAVKFSQTARNGQIVVAQVMEDAFRGELGDALTLKVYRTGENRGFYRADGTQAHSSIGARIVGIVVKHYPAKVPSIL